ncbi:MAG TPA: hypothetical protein VMU59_02075 [Caulobacteraceae bacterium]|nr:hypothetical protein [Caulobacteraceae bacterium]
MLNNTEQKALASISLFPCLLLWMPPGQAPAASDFEKADLWPSVSEAVRHAQVLASADRRPWVQTSAGVMAPEQILGEGWQPAF